MENHHLHSTVVEPMEEGWQGTFRLRLSTEHRTATITPEGDLCLHSAPLLASAIPEGYLAEVLRVRCDLDSLAFVDVFGVRALGELPRALDRPVAYMNLPEMVRRITTALSLELAEQSA